MVNILDREVAMSLRDKEIATEASWQAHYILCSRIMGIPDPCGSEPGYERIMGIYILSFSNMELTTQTRIGSVLQP